MATTLDWSDKALHAGDAVGVAALLRLSAVLTSINLASNRLCGVDRRGRGTFDASGIQALALAISVNAQHQAVLTHLGLSGNQLCGLGEDGEGTYDASGITALSEALKVTASLTRVC